MSHTELVCLILVPNSGNSKIQSALTLPIFKIMLQLSRYFSHLPSSSALSQSWGAREPSPPPPPQFLADQLTLSRPGGAHYACHINTGTLRFSDLPTTLHVTIKI